MSELIAPTARLEDAWREAYADASPGVVGLSPPDLIDSAAGFAAWIARLAGDPWHTYRWIVDRGRVLGGVIIDVDGRIGFDLWPSARRRALPRWMLSRMLDEARGLGLTRVVITCPDDDGESAATIESQGGVLESSPGIGPRRYGVTVPVVVAEILGLDLGRQRTGGLRFLRDPETARWMIDLPPIYHVATSAAEVREFAQACRTALAVEPGEYDVYVFFDDGDEGILGIETRADGTVNLQLVLNLSGAVSMDAADYDRDHLERVTGALLAAAG